MNQCLPSSDWLYCGLSGHPASVHVTKVAKQYRPTLIMSLGNITTSRAAWGVTQYNNNINTASLACSLDNNSRDSC